MIGLAETGQADAVLLSHDHTPTISTWASAAARLGGNCRELALVTAQRPAPPGRLAPIDIAVLFAGAARTPLLGDAYLTLTSTQAAQAAQILDAGQVIPPHYNGWSHFTEGADDLRTAFTQAGLAERLTLLAPGRSTPVEAGA